MELQVEILSRETIKPAISTPAHLKHHKLSLLDQLCPLCYAVTNTCYAPPNKIRNGDNITIMSNNDTFVALKESLTKALTLYYPLAGRLALDESSINCNDEGIPFVEARCDCSLSAFLHAQNRADFVWRFVPSIIIPPSAELCPQTNSRGEGHGNIAYLWLIRKIKLIGSTFQFCCIHKADRQRVHRAHQIAGEASVNFICFNINRSLTAVELVLMAVQVTIFNCGGVMIGVKGIHKIMDATSFGSFFKCWSDFASGGDQVNNKPDFTTAATLFPPRPWAALEPPREPLPFSKLDGNRVPKGCAVKEFHFSPQSLSTLQANARSSDRLLNPTRLEAVSGFIWKHAMAAAATSKNRSYFGPSVMTHAVNVRPRMRPELPPTTFGSLVIHAFAYYKGQDKDDDNKNNNNNINNETKISVPGLSDLVTKVSRALASAKDADYLNKLKGEKGSELIRENKQKLANYWNDDGNMNIYRCTSWSNVGLDYPNFGFLGKAVWNGHEGILKNQILFVMNQNKGIEVALTLDKKEMEILQSNSEFLQFASPM